MAGELKKWICPDCMGELERVDGQSAKCVVHGGVYQVLFADVPPPAFSAPPVPLTVPQFEVGAKCSKHANVTATRACNRCGVPMCETCAFPRAGGRQVCLECVPFEPEPDSLGAPPPIPAPKLPAGAKCNQHPNVDAVVRCDFCRCYLCATCEFQFAGNIHLCPACATKPQNILSSKRKRLMWASYATAVISTVSLALIAAGAFASMARTPGGEAALGYLFIAIMLGPALAGMGMGLTAMERRRSNPIALWIPTIWNVLLAAGFLVLCIIGNLSK